MMNPSKTRDIVDLRDPTDGPLDMNPSRTRNTVDARDPTDGPLDDGFKQDKTVLIRDSYKRSNRAQWKQS